MQVYQAINNVQKALCKVGISKDRTNTQGQSYKFRGIDDVYNALSPLLAEHGLCILPRMISRVHEERQSKAGNALFYVTVQAEFDFVSAVDGSKHTVATFGEAMDSGDKATNKAMSAAYKYAAFQAFAIPTEGDNDADAQTHEVQTTRDHSGKPDTSVVAGDARVLTYAARFRDAMDADEEEPVKARMVFTIHDELNKLKDEHKNELYAAAAAELPANYRNAIKTYVQQHKKSLASV